jgi:hypothetical protein
MLQQYTVHEPTFTDVLLAQRQHAANLLSENLNI